jgi:4-hydroxybenzoate polyprenyltransferase
MKKNNKIITYFRLARFHAAASESLLILIAALLMGLEDKLSLIMLFIIGLLYHVYLFVLNEYTDIEVDKKSKDLIMKPLVSGEIPKKHALIISISAAVICYIITIIFFQSLFALFLLTMAFIFGALYDYYGKKIKGYSDFLVAASLAFIFLYGAGAVSIYLTNLIYIIGFMIFLAIIFANAVEGGLKDVDHDYLGGAKTVATLMGVKVKDKKLIMTKKFQLFAISLICMCFILLILLGLQPEISLFDFEFLKLGIITFLVILILITSSLLITLKEFNRIKIKRLYAILNSAGGALLLIILVPLIGIEITIILLIVPIAWYLSFNIILYGKPMQPGV